MLFVFYMMWCIFWWLDSVLIFMCQVWKGELDVMIDIGLDENERGDEIDEVVVNYNKMLYEVKYLMIQVVDK